VEVDGPLNSELKRAAAGHGAVKADLRAAMPDDAVMVVKLADRRFHEGILPSITAG